MIIDLPIIVCGKVIKPDERETVFIKNENGVNIRIPMLNEDDVDEILNSRLKTGLAEMPFDDITVFFEKLAAFWLREENPFRDEAVRLCSLVTGFPAAVVERDYKLIVHLFRNRGDVYDQLETEIGNRWYIDEWVPSQSCLIRAFPRGLVTNILVGNIPMVSSFGLYRNLVVKNNSLSKVPKKDPVSAIYFALSLLEINPDHPITKSVSVAYWEKDSWQEEKFLHNSDAVCLWGGENAINELKSKIKMGTKVLEYGPKKSLTLADLSAMEPDDNMRDIALRIAHDFSVYNQEACFTPQELYLVADDNLFVDFIDHLQSALNRYLHIYEKGELSSDSKAHVLITRTEAQLLGNTVISTPDHGWTIIVAQDNKRIDSHPLNRTVIIHRVSALEEAAPHINKYTQTVTLYPWRASERLRDLICGQGADRICALGMANIPRTGFPHDGIWTFNELLRWVNVERDLDFKGKYVNVNKDAWVERLFRTEAVSLF
ncbi:acyl-CoA reductase [Syntrophomonas palmitatica]|uniref:acyl-CoA reductase n=1 Tax=Syntrophomonas palmitatica TaxID=402877 RepID=UPI0006CFE8DD|nr:acyl-CoA reductase [Syntrophomonas palmitatica]